MQPHTQSLFVKTTHEKGHAQMATATITTTAAAIALMKKEFVVQVPLKGWKEVTFVLVGFWHPEAENGKSPSNALIEDTIEKLFDLGPHVQQIIAVSHEYQDKRFAEAARKHVKTAAETKREILGSNVVMIPDDAAFTFIRVLNKRFDSEAALSQQILPIVSPHVEFLMDEYGASAQNRRVVFVSLDWRLAENAFDLAALLKISRMKFSTSRWMCSRTTTLDNVLAMVSDLPTNPNRRTWADCDDVAPMYAPLTRIDDMQLMLENVKSIDQRVVFKETLFKMRYEQLSSSAKNALFDLIEEGLDIVRCHLRAGYHVSKNEAPVPGWALQCGGNWLSLIISVYGLKPRLRDFPLINQEYVCMDSWIRKQLCLYSISTLSSFFAFYTGAPIVITPAMIAAFNGDGPAYNSELFWDAVYDEFRRWRRVTAAAAAGAGAAGAGAAARV